MAFVSLANYTQPNFEFGYAMKFMRVIILVFTAMFGICGYVGGLIFVAISIVKNKTIGGTSYIYPIYPFSIKKLARRFFRISLRNVKQ